MWCSGAWDGHQPCGAAFDPGVALQVEAAAFPEHDVALLAYAQPAFTFFSLEPGLTWFVGISTTSILAGEVTHQFVISMGADRASAAGSETANRRLQANAAVQLNICNLLLPLIQMLSVFDEIPKQASYRVDRGS